jgi:hypothetical protein
VQPLVHAGTRDGRLGRVLHRRVRAIAYASGAILALAACGETSTASETEEERARAAAEEVAKNCHNPDAPKDSCAVVEELSQLRPGNWRTRIRLFNGRDICVKLDLDRFERVGDNLRGVDRTTC